jgi:DNA-binding NarL/FixJ family response regulator
LAAEPKPIRIVLADDHALLLEGLASLIGAERDLRVIATASDGERLLEAIRRFKPDVAVVDIKMPYMDGPTCIRRIRTEGLTVRVVVLSALSDAPAIRDAIEAGADGFVLKTDPPQATLAAIRQVFAGQLVFPQGARRWLTQQPQADALSERESAVLTLLAEGKSNADIARALRMSENTVKFHLRNLYSKLGVSNRTEAAARYHRRS